MKKRRKKITYCTEKCRSAPCHYAWYDRLFELGVIRCARASGTCKHQNVAYEDTLRKRWQKKCESGE